MLEKEKISEYKLKRRLASNGIFTIISQYNEGNIRSETKAFSIDYEKHELSIAMENENWEKEVIPKLVNYFSKFNIETREKVVEATLTSDSLESLIEKVYSKEILDNQYESSKHPLWLLYAIDLEDMFEQRERLSTKDRNKERDERWFYKKVKLNMSYKEVQQSEINDGYSTNKKPPSTSNIKKVIGKMLDNDYSTEQARYFVAPM
ncbi:hypothetical protein JHD45_15885 [Marinomonas spartinae]|nr:hypothetical protein [Marinomonas spartinae]